jgi:RNA-directed DNA polymerase
LGNLSTPKSVQKLQTALHAKAKAEASYRFYALYDKISRDDILAHAYAQCRSNKGAPGVDGQEFADIEAYGVQRWLGELALALKQETYRSDPIRRVFIPKANGKLRPLGISTLRDRVCMTAAMLGVGTDLLSRPSTRAVRLPPRAQGPTGGGRRGSAGVPGPFGSR